MADRSWVEDPESVEDWSPVKRSHLWWRLVKISMFLPSMCLLAVVLNGYLALSSGLGWLWLGPILGLPGLVVAVVGLRLAFRMIADPRPARTGPYWILLAAGVLAFLGLALPWYLYA